MLGGIVSVQSGAAVATQLFHRIGPGGAVLLRIAIGTIVLVPIWRPAVRRRTREEWRLAVLFGFVLAAMNLAFYHAIQRIPLGVAVTLEFTGPLAVAVAGSRRRLDLLWVALAAGGILALLRLGGGGLDPGGVVLALAAGALWGAYIHTSARVGRAFAGGSGLALAMCVASLLVAPVGFAEGGVAVLAPRSLLLGAAVAVLSSVVPYSFELEALRRIAPGVFGVLMSIEPAVAALAGLVVLGQSLSLRAAAGICLVVLASAGASSQLRDGQAAQVDR